VFFPEGTFDAVPGLKRFHVGAFAAAVRGEMPVVPVVILGARRAMPGGAMLVRPGRIRVEILEPIAVPVSVHAADEMRIEARRRMVARLDEPDLAPEPRRSASPRRGPASLAGFAEGRARDVIDRPDLARQRDDIGRVADDLERARPIEPVGDHAEAAVAVHAHERALVSIGR
jgi:hypothetical protein